MTNKDFVTPEQELVLKELGCYISFETIEYERRLYVDSGGNETNESYVKEIKKRKILYQQAFRFFREKYNILANVYSNASGYLFEWHDSIGGTHRGWSDYEGPNDSGVWDTYEEAETKCLDKLIQIVKDNDK